MRNTWTSLVGLGACCIFSVLLLSDVSWALPKKTYWSCKCSCRWVDELGKEHFGPTGGVQFTESSLENCLGHNCTTTTPTGTHQGTTRDCMGTEHENTISVPPGGVQGTLQQTPTTPGGMRAPIPGTIQRRGVEGEAPDTGTAKPESPAPESK